MIRNVLRVPFLQRIAHLAHLPISIDIITLLIVAAAETEGELTVIFPLLKNFTLTMRSFPYHAILNVKVVANQLPLARLVEMIQSKL